MGNEIARLGRDAERDERALDSRRKLRKIRRGFHTAPQNARAALIWEKTESAELHLDELGGMDRRERGADGRELRRIYLANKFQGDVHRLWPHPFGAAAFRLQARDQFVESLAHRVREIECDEQPHSSGPAVRGI